MSAKGFSTLAAVIFIAVALIQLARALGFVHVDVTIENTPVPVVASWVIFAVMAVLAFLGFTSRGT
jgi:branched-subunit amino acid transport protein AzlD